MTEAEWWVCADPQAMLANVEPNAGERTLRLLCAAFCRRAWHLLETDNLRQAVHLLERFAESEIGEESFRAAARSAHPLMNYRDELFAGQARDEIWYAAYAVNAAMSDIPSWRYRKTLEFLTHAAGPSGDDERAAHVGLIREVFGNPYRHVAVSPAWLTYTVLRLAQAAYEDRSLPAGTLHAARLGILADALEEAGCTAVEMLGHLRGSGPHVRGCWALDLLLGKE
jgi:hypothetical protein